ncbi:MAG TPA: RyR domain-containing protein [Gemmatimonadales bacterium]|nr:RyR domain-containing protein [Gemmatimonadales bacterium]
MEHKFSDEQVAAVCHEANRQVQRMFGEQVNFPWENTGPDLRNSIIDGVRKIRSGEVTTPEQSHRNWCQYKTDEGWVYGEVKNFATKEHPQLVPYEVLPAEQQYKDRVFWAIVKALG